jgi:hypothetical protein
MESLFPPPKWFLWEMVNTVWMESYKNVYKTKSSAQMLSFNYCKCYLNLTNIFIIFSWQVDSKIHKKA